MAHVPGVENSPLYFCQLFRKDVPFLQILPKIVGESHRKSTFRLPNNTIRRRSQHRRHRQQRAHSQGSSQSKKSPTYCFVRNGPVRNDTTCTLQIAPQITRLADECYRSMKKVKTLDEFLLSKDSVCLLNSKVIGTTEDEKGSLCILDSSSLHPSFMPT